MHILLIAWEAFPISDRGAIGIGASFYLVAFLVGMLTLREKKPAINSLIFVLLGAGFLMQFFGLNIRGAQIKACPLGNTFEITQFITWSLVMLFFIIGPVFRVRLLGFFTAGLAALLSGGSLIFPGLDSPYPPGLFGGNPWIELHAALAIFSYGVFAIVALVSAMFLIQQHGLKTKQFKGVYQILPSVQQLDTIAQRLNITGVVMLSLALIFGAVFWVGNPELVPFFKLTVTCLVWAGYLTVAFLRIQKKLVTRRHAIAAIILFLLALASLWPVQSARNSDATAIRPSSHSLAQ
ncbi:MAG: cytochrome c biogenesis protein CcsA [Verrucomicrobiota bacterium]